MRILFPYVACALSYMSVACVLINSIEATSVCGIMSLQTVAAAAYLVIALNRKKKRRKPRWWRRQLYVGGQEAQNDFLNKLIADDQALFRNFTRMSQEDFEYLLEKISPIIRKSDTNFREAIPTRIRLLVTLRYLATGDSYASLMYLFRISVPSISRIIPEVCKALIDVLHDFVRIPDTEDGWKKILKYSGITHTVLERVMGNTSSCKTQKTVAAYFIITKELLALF
ncbi:unnamed protein product [Acanthoscelides obtectus]|uniref:Nuclease HARBI1 n=1 Tax=Acanthoscelides obtectus TaxID=200917 RepID=A0A9P0PBH1_ACAOB|nr:unnamed protein product [Acanthoscelides obtectus]CAK1655813.1 hypothetical protein AOBTE_LOCUS19357 [Acanthoscelides obtectus]